MKKDRFSRENKARSYRGERNSVVALSFWESAPSIHPAASVYLKSRVFERSLLTGLIRFCRALATRVEGSLLFVIASAPAPARNPPRMRATAGKKRRVIWLICLLRTINYRRTYLLMRRDPLQITGLLSPPHV